MSDSGNDIEHWVPGHRDIEWNVLADRQAMGNITVDLKGVAKLLDGLNIHKAPGPDGLNTSVLKECSNEISPILALIFNKSLARDDVPDEWRQANVSLVFKKGEKYDEANYRPVSLTCICCKTIAGLQIRVRIGKLFSLFLIQNICCGYSKEPSQ